jgi:hypothetical protein
MSKILLSWRKFANIREKSGGVQKQKWYLVSMTTPIMPFDMGHSSKPKLTCEVTEERVGTTKNTTCEH